MDFDVNYIYSFLLRKSIVYAHVHLVSLKDVHTVGNKKIKLCSKFFSVGNYNKKNVYGRYLKF